VGLKAGERLIVEGLMKVRPGASVKAVPWASLKAGQAAMNANPSPAQSN
jgi:membrane fusion protein (multidrug efflux system)